MTDALATIGHNGAPDPFDALRVHTDDLLDQARTIAAVTTAEQLEAVDNLAADLRDAGDQLEALRVERKKPLDEAINAIQELFNPYLAPLKNKVAGKIPLALDAIKKAKEPYLQEQERLRQEEARRQREAAEQAAREAAEAARAAAGEDMEAREEAEAQVIQAQAMTRNATRAEAAVSRGSGLRSFWVADLIDPNAAIKHYIARNPDAVKDFLREMARKDIAAGLRTVPGFDVREERRAA